MDTLSSQANLAGILQAGVDSFSQFLKEQFRYDDDMLEEIPATVVLVVGAGLLVYKLVQLLKEWEVR